MKRVLTPQARRSPPQAPRSRGKAPPSPYPCQLPGARPPAAPGANAGQENRHAGPHRCVFGETGRRGQGARAGSGRVLGECSATPGDALGPRLAGHPLAAAPAPPPAARRRSKSSATRRDCSSPSMPRAPTPTWPSGCRASRAASAPAGTSAAGASAERLAASVLTLASPSPALEPFRRKAFRLGKFLGDVNAVRKTPFGSPYFLLEWLSSGGEGVYYCVDQLQW